MISIYENPPGDFFRRRQLALYPRISWRSRKTSFEWKGHGNSLAIPKKVI